MRDRLALWDYIQPRGNEYYTQDIQWVAHNHLQPRRQAPVLKTEDMATLEFWKKLVSINIEQAFAIRYKRQKRKDVNQTTKHSSRIEVWGKKERQGERRRVEGEESENRSLVSGLLHITVALLPAGDIQGCYRAKRTTNLCTVTNCPQQHPQVVGCRPVSPIVISLTPIRCARPHMQYDDNVLPY